MWFNWNTTRRRHHTTKTPLMDSGDESCFKQFNLLHQFTMHKQFDLTQNGKESKSNRKLENSITPSKTRGLCYKRAPPSKLLLVDWTKHSMLWCIIDNKRRTSILFMRNRKKWFLCTRRHQITQGLYVPIGLFILVIYTRTNQVLWHVLGALLLLVDVELSILVQILLVMWTT